MRGPWGKPTCPRRGPCSLITPSYPSFQPCTPTSLEHLPAQPKWQWLGQDAALVVQGLSQWKEVYPHPHLGLNRVEPARKV